MPLSSFSYLSPSPFIFIISHHSFFPLVGGLNKNKLDKRIDMNHQNLNNKTSNHNMKKRKTVWWTSVGFTRLDSQLDFMWGFMMRFARSWGSLDFAAMVAEEITFVGFYDEVAVEITVGFYYQYFYPMNKDKEISTLNIWN